MTSLPQRLLQRAPDLLPSSAALSKRVSGSAIEAVLTGFSRAMRLHPSSNFERHGVERISDIPYLDTGLAEHTLDIYRPAERHGRLLPVVFYIHGGGFRILSKDTHWMPGLYFAQRGWLVVNINYRLAPRYPYPAAVEDTASAFAWAAKQAAVFGGDMERLVVAGESAGANLTLGVALSMAYQRDEPWARQIWDTQLTAAAILPACGMLQASDPGRFDSKPDIPAWMRHRIEAVSESYLDAFHTNDPQRLDYADPLVVLERGHAPDRPLPPCFAPVGTSDPVIDDTRRLKRALDALGVPCEAPEYPGGHAFHLFHFPATARACWDDTFAFLDTHGPPMTR